MLRIYRTTARFMVKNFVVLVSTSLLIFAGNVAVEYFDASLTAMFVAWAMVAYVFHRALMFGEADLWRRTAPPVRPNATGRFILIFGGIALPILGGSLWVAIIVAKNVDPSLAEDAIIGTGLFTYATLSLVFLPLLGTMLPAAAAADTIGLRKTLQRAKTTWFKVLAGLIVGPGLYWIAYLGGLIWLTSNILQIDQYRSPADGWQIEQLVLGLMLSFLQVVPVLLTAVVLCLAYKDVASPEVQEVMQPELNAG